jgi:hypothetical protein
VSVEADRTDLEAGASVYVLQVVYTCRDKFSVKSRHLPAAIYSGMVDQSPNGEDAAERSACRYSAPVTVIPETF